MVVALNMTSASSFQMLRGAVIIFTGLLSVAFLGRRLIASQWIGIFVTILGLVIVGLADLFSGRHDSHKISDIVTGDVHLGALHHPPGSPLMSSSFQIFAVFFSCRRPSDHHGSDYSFSADGP